MPRRVVRSAGGRPTVCRRSTDAASKLQAGQISDVLRSANGFHIVRLIDKRQGEQKAVVEQSKARHILVR